jgi:transformation/transcription domain-associated protein
MFVELQEAGQMCTLLLDTNASNFDSRFQELKALLQSWRERLPNYWDDMNQWSDLVAWRQLMFGAVNRTFLPLGSVLPPTVTASSAANSGIAGNSLAYRGYHEMAWMINRFARIARKHGMLDVCMNQLARIYTLPNIEIHEAFIKLKEQARCNLKNVGELASGLEVINNTNLAYFGVRQKAEFFALKGDFLARLERNDEANVAYAAATNADLNLSKAWSSWGRFLDGLFQQHPDQIEYASRAMDCYLQACCLQRSPKSRRHIARILWLLSTDDAQGTVAKAFETFKGDVAIWYWLTFIPQLLSQLSSRTARHARLVLERIAKSFPQVNIKI